MKPKSIPTPQSQPQKKPFAAKGTGAYSYQAAPLFVTSGYKLLFVDDEDTMLDGMTINAKDANVDVRVFLMKESNGLLPYLERLVREGWHPDAVVMDLNSATGDAVTGIGYLKQLRTKPEFFKLSVVITTANESNSTEALNIASDALKHGADGYMLGKTTDLTFLKQCRNQVAFWQTQARARVWHELLRKTANALNLAKDQGEIRAALKDSFSFMKTYLGIPHAFVRERRGVLYPMWVQHGGEWATEHQTNKLDDLPPVRACLEKAGQVFAQDHITHAFAGKFGDKLMGMHMRGCALMLEGEPVGVMTVMRDKECLFFPQDDVFIERLAERIASVMGNRKLHADVDVQSIYAFAARQFTHVLNNKLATLIASVEQVTRGVSTDANAALREVGKGLANIQLRGNKMALYMRPPECKKISVALLWQELQTEFADHAKGKGVCVSSWPADAGQASAWADREILWNVLYILIDNALMALEAQSGDKTISVNWRQDADQGVARIQDNGPGIPKAWHDRLGQEFGLSSKTDGQGVALPLAKQRMKSMGGDLSFVKDFAPGAAFDVCVPLREK